MLWSSHKLRRKEWRQPLKENHPKKAGKGPEKQRDLCRMRARMWVLLQINVGREGH